jgi:hypothetical protein
MINEILQFANGYRMIGIKNITGREGSGWSATIIKDDMVIGEAADYGDGGPVNIKLNTKEQYAQLLEYAKTVMIDCSCEISESFLSELVNYEFTIKSLKTKAKKKLLVVDETKLDEYGISNSYSAWNFPDTVENRKYVLNKEPNTKFLNDELNIWENKIPKKLKL